MNSIKTNIYFKVAIIIIIALLLLIPTTMIEGLISERETTQFTAISEVSGKWGNQQTISGPFISIPFTCTYVEKSTKDSTQRVIEVKDFIHILPSELNIEGDINPEQRNRGIFEIVVYNSKINISGKFLKSNFSDLDIPTEDILFD